MNFDREQLLSILNDLKPALGADNSFIKAYSHFFFDGQYVYAFDGGLGLRIKLKTNLKGGLPGRVFLDLLKTSALKEIFLDVVDDRIVLQMGKSKVKLLSLSDEVFFGNPARVLWRFPASAPTDAVELELTDDILEAISRVAFVRIGKAVQAMHYGITVIQGKGCLEFYASDSRTLARVKIESDVHLGISSFILPWAFVDRILDLAEEGSMLYVLKDCIMVEAGAVNIYSTMLETTEVPNLPKTSASYLMTPSRLPLPAGFQPVLERAQILAEKDIAAPVRFAIKGETLSLAGDYTLGALSESLALKSKHPEASGAFGAGLVLRGLPAADSFSLGARALVLFGGKDFVYIVSQLEQRTRDAV